VFQMSYLQRNSSLLKINYSGTEASEAKGSRGVNGFPDVSPQMHIPYNEHGVPFFSDRLSTDSKTGFEREVWEPKYVCKHARLS
jgi:hypothetical protein